MSELGEVLSLYHIIYVFALHAFTPPSITALAVPESYLTAKTGGGACLLLD